MSSLEVHEAEQAEITRQCEAGECDHLECKMGALEMARAIIDAEGSQDDNRRRAARALLCYLPAYDDDPKDSLTDFLADIMHLCDIAGWSFGDLRDMARRNYLIEMDECGIAKHDALARAIREG